MSARYFEDIVVGETWQSRPYQVTEAEIVDFARHYDPQPMHTDAVYAATGPHGGLIASGWMVASLSMKLFVEQGGFGDTPLLGLGVEDMRWLAVVRPGDVVVSRREVVEARRSKSNPGKGLIKTRVSMVNGAGTEVLRLTVTAMIDARAGA